MGFFSRHPDPDDINPATGRPHRDDAGIAARAAEQDRQADEAIEIANRAYQQRMSRHNARSN
jgi:hypothetical protein